MTTLRDRGLRVPDDVAVAGFDDSALDAIAGEPHTSVTIPATLVVRRSV